jgi:hypothetical protein
MPRTGPRLLPWRIRAAQRTLRTTIHRRFSRFQQTGIRKPVVSVKKKVVAKDPAFADARAEAEPRAIDKVENASEPGREAATHRREPRHLG